MSPTRRCSFSSPGVDAPAPPRGRLRERPPPPPVLDLARWRMAASESPVVYAAAVEPCVEPAPGWTGAPPSRRVLGRRVDVARRGGGAQPPFSSSPSSFLRYSPGGGGANPTPGAEEPFSSELTSVARAPRVASSRWRPEASPERRVDLGGLGKYESGRGAEGSALRAWAQGFGLLRPATRELRRGEAAKRESVCDSPGGGLVLERCQPGLVALPLALPALGISSAWVWWLGDDASDGGVSLAAVRECESERIRRLIVPPRRGFSSPGLTAGGDSVASFSFVSAIAPVCVVMVAVQAQPRCTDQPAIGRGAESRLS